VLVFFFFFFSLKILFFFFFFFFFFYFFFKSGALLFLGPGAPFIVLGSAGGFDDALGVATIAGRHSGVPRIPLRLPMIRQAPDRVPRRRTRRRTGFRAVHEPAGAAALRHHIACAARPFP
ncbi:hypothetical protein, partial [Gordonia sp. 852002-51296_SCH5728562-b]|uniref:hypothetical protein n=1 Tax=Gordonia sp. 852002-51296_SCH5728562-b TaxID=1834101 RepID=UPI001E522462